MRRSILAVLMALVGGLGLPVGIDLRQKLLERRNPGRLEIEQRAVLVEQDRIDLAARHVQLTC